MQKLFLTFFPDVDLRLEPVAEEGLGLVVAQLVDGLLEVVVQVLQQLVVLLVHLQIGLNRQALHQAEGF